MPHILTKYIDYTNIRGGGGASSIVEKAYNKIF